MTVREIAPRLASAFGDYKPASEFERKTIEVLDRILLAVTETREEVARLRAQVERNTEQGHRVQTQVVELRTRFDESDRTAQALAEAAKASAQAAFDSAAESERSRGLLDEERRAAHRLGQEGRPLTELGVPEDRKTDPGMARSSRPPPGEE